MGTTAIGTPYIIKLVEKCPDCGRIRYIYDKGDKSTWFAPNNTLTFKLAENASLGDCGCQDKK